MFGDTVLRRTGRDGKGSAIPPTCRFFPPCLRKGRNHDPRRGLSKANDSSESSCLNRISQVAKHRPYASRVEAQRVS
jgi:hypothetical protein